MLKAIRKSCDFDRKSLDNFPCDDLRTIDQLWVKYSQGRFGFSVQKKIWLELGGKVNYKGDYETEEKLGNRVGWKVGNSTLECDDLTFNLQAPRGQLPSWRWWGYGFFCEGEGVLGLFSRLDSCQKPGFLRNIWL